MTRRMAMQARFSGSMLEKVASFFSFSLVPTSAAGSSAAGVVGWSLRFCSTRFLARLSPFSRSASSFSLWSPVFSSSLSMTSCSSFCRASKLAGVATRSFWITRRIAMQDFLSSTGPFGAGGSAAFAGASSALAGSSFSSAASSFFSSAASSFFSSAASSFSSAASSIVSSAASSFFSSAPSSFSSSAPSSLSMSTSPLPPAGTSGDSKGTSLTVFSASSKNARNSSSSSSPSAFVSNSSNISSLVSFLLSIWL
mmetsp:Transcript_39902/g.119429  ORF Transcript_39902/g.119429 Transcript_39902/m.119429 type:complete len:254 (-) Transcript_39902:843-1604(-)